MTVPTVLDLESLMRRMAEERVANSAEPATTKKAREAAWRKHTLTPDQRKQARELFTAVPDVLAVFDPVNPAPLTPQQASILMEEHTALTEAALVLKGRLERVREIVFGALDAGFAEDGVEDPELHPGTVEVPAQGKKFCREGGGRQDPTLDVDALREALGDDVVNSLSDVVIHPREVIEEWTEQVLDEDRLAAWLTAHPDMIESVRGAVLPGAPKTIRFTVRPLA